MVRGIESILLSSQHPKKLAMFYKDTVGLTMTLEAQMGEDNEDLYGFDMKQGSGLYIMHHSNVKGTSKQPERYLLNFEVDVIEKEVKRLVKEGVKLVKDIYHMEGYGKIATFEDPDGNYFQFVQVKAA